MQISAFAAFGKNCSLTIVPNIKGWPTKQSCSGTISKLAIPAAKSPTAYTFRYSVTGVSGTASRAVTLGVGIVPTIASCRFAQRLQREEGGYSLARHFSRSQLYLTSVRALTDYGPCKCGTCFSLPQSCTPCLYIRDSA